jgi:predicted acyl esterase
MPATSPNPPTQPRAPRPHFSRPSLLLPPALSLAFVAVASLVQSADEGLDLGAVREVHEMVPMRDGTRLSVYLYFPGEEKDGPWPAIFEQRYASLRAKGARESAAKLARGGYAVALANFRGTHLSEGKWVGYRATQFGELRDGYDLCEWLAAQPWSTGKVGTFGSSQGGYVQNYLAVTQPPHLVCQYMVDTGLSLFHEGYRIGGTTKPERFRRMSEICRAPRDNDELLAEWFRHPTYDDYWRAEDCTPHFAKMDVPCFTIGSWFDFMNQGSIASFRGREHEGGPGSRGRQWLLVGPWLHGRTNKGTKNGELLHPDNAAWPVEDHMLRWFDHWLKGIDTGIAAEPKVRWYEMGAVGEPGTPGNRWHEAGDFPPASRPASLYLREGARLDRAPSDQPESSTSYLSDPRQPMILDTAGFPGARDAREFEEQSEVRTFTTEALAEPVAWIGRVEAELFLSSTAPDTDVIVRVSDVYPDGRSILLIDYPCRLRFREGFEKEVPMEPGRVYPVRFPVGWLGQTFAAGHRIRVTVASTAAPYYEPNPQDGGPLVADFPENARAATNTIHHSAAHPSRIIVPVAE